MSINVKKSTPSHLDRLYAISEIKKPYGITERKKAELDTLTEEVLDAQFEVAQFQAIVTSLNEKLVKFQGFLADAENNRESTLNNKNLTDQLVQSTFDLLTNSNITFTEMGLADAKTTTLSDQIKSVVDKLIYSAEVINKLANLIVRRKAMDPLISDEIVSRINTAGNDANNAVALTLIALQSSFAAQATNMESQSATALEYYQALDFYQLLTGLDDLADTASPLLKPVKRDGSLFSLMHQAYHDAKKQYDEMYHACKVVANQLNSAQSKLNQATINLASLQSGLSAGMAAALAS